MKKSFWIFLILSAALVIFSVLNADPVDVNILFKEVKVSLAILLIIVFLSGVIAGASYFFLKTKLKKQKPPAKDEQDLSETNVED